MMLAPLCALVYATLFVRGLRRSRTNIMSRSLRDAVLLRERHSWRWWVWTVCCRPAMGIDRGGVYLCACRVYLPWQDWLPPVHYRVRYR